MHLCHSGTSLGKELFPEMLKAVLVPRKKSDCRSLRFVWIESEGQANRLRIGDLSPAAIERRRRVRSRSGFPVVPHCPELGVSIYVYWVSI